MLGIYVSDKKSTSYEETAWRRLHVGKKGEGDDKLPSKYATRQNRRELRSRAKGKTRRGTSPFSGGSLDCIDPLASGYRGAISIQRAPPEGGDTATGIRIQESRTLSFLTHLNTSLENSRK